MPSKHDCEKPQRSASKEEVMARELSRKRILYEKALLNTTRQEISKAVTEVLELLTMEEATEIWKQLPGVVIVDDTPTIPRSLKRAFFRFVKDGDTIQTFLDPQEALQAILQLPPNSLIISDNSMPGLSGIELAKEVQKVAADRQFTFTLHTTDTGGKFRESLNSGFEDGSIDVFVSKPPDLSYMIKMCALKILSKRPREE